MKNNHRQKNNGQLTANVIGATGLVGKNLVGLLLNDSRFVKVRIFVRRDSGITHPKLEQQIVDFHDTGNWKKHLKGNVLFSALGTTLKKAGSKEKQYEVDFRFNLNFANQARENDIKTYVLVSSVGANAKSPFFYSRIKGELDDAVLNLRFPELVILRPSALAGERDETRWMEKLSLPVVGFVTRFILKKYRTIEGSTVAKAMINASLNPTAEKSIWTAGEIFVLAEE